MRRLLVGWLVLMLAACEKPASPRPEWEVRYEAARKEADAAFAANHSFKAAEMYRVALGALPQSDPRRDECNQKIATCTFLDLREKGLQFLSQDKTEEALMAFEKAVTLLPKGLESPEGAPAGIRPHLSLYRP